MCWILTYFCLWKCLIYLVSRVYLSSFLNRWSSVINAYHGGICFNRNRARANLSCSGRIQAFRNGTWTILWSCRNVAYNTRVLAHRFETWICNNTVSLIWNGLIDHIWFVILMNYYCFFINYITNIILQYGKIFLSRLLQQSLIWRTLFFIWT